MEGEEGSETVVVVESSVTIDGEGSEMGLESKVMIDDRGSEGASKEVLSDSSIFQ